MSTHPPTLPCELVSCMGATGRGSSGSYGNINTVLLAG